MQGGMVCVSIPTDDGVSVKLGHFGDARYYLHYVWSGDGWRLVRRIENPYAGRHHHGVHGGEESGKRPRIYELNKECDVIVAVAFGRGGAEFMERRGLRVVRVRPRTGVEEALRLVEEELGLRRAT